MLVPPSDQAAHATFANISDKSRRLQIEKYIRDLTEAQAEIAATSAAFQQQQLQRASAVAPPTTALMPGEWVSATWPGDRRPTKLSVLWKGPYRVIGLRPGEKMCSLFLLCRL